LDAVSWRAAVSGNWSQASNWNPHAPGTGDTAIIDATGSNYTVTLDVNPTIAGFTLNSANATFSASGQTFTVNGPANVSAGTLLWRSSTWTGTGTLTNAASMVAQGSSLVSSTFAQNGTLWVQGSNVGQHATLTAASGFNNAGAIRLESIDQTWASNLTMTSGTLTNMPTGVINANAGSGGGRTISANLTNNGTVNLNTGSTALAGVFTNTAGFNIPATGAVTMNGSSQAFNQNGGTFSNAGSLSLSLGAVFTQNGGTLNNTGSFALSDGNLNLNAGTVSSTTPMILTHAALTIGSASTASGTIVIHGACTLSGNVQAGQTVWVQGSNVGQHATLTAASGFSNAGAIRLESIDQNWASNLTVTSGTLTNAGAGVINVNAGSGGGRTISANLTNNGTVNLNTGSTALAGVFTNTAGFNIPATGAVTMNGSGQALNQDGGTFSNAGSVSLSSGAVFTQNGGTLNNTGSFALSDGNLNLNGGAVTGTTPMILTHAALVIGSGATAGGTIIIHGACTLSGNLQAGQTVWVQGSNVGQHATLTAASGFSNAGAIRLESIDQNWASNLTVTSGTLTNTTTGVIIVNPGTGGERTLAAQLDNQGTVNISQATNLVKDSAAHRNSGTIVVNGGTMNVNQSGQNPSFTNTGIIDVETGSLAVTAGGLTLDGAGILRSTAGASISIGGNLVGRTSNADRFAPLGPVVMSGPGTAQSPQLLEIISRDLGNVSQGFTRNFAYGTLALANNTYVRLVSAGMTVLYANSLIVPAGTTLDLNGLHVYARVVQISGTVVGGMVNQPPPGPITLGTPAGGFVANDQQIDEWTFFGRSDQAVTVIVNTNAGLNFAHVRILDPNNGVIGDRTNMQSGADVAFLGQALQLDGTYRIQVSAGQPSSRGNYLVTAWNATGINRPLNLNQQLNGQIDTPYRIDNWNFSAAAGTQIQFDLLNRSNPAIRFDLTGPNGYLREMLGNGDLVTLPNAGNYVLTVAATNQQTGSYAFRVRQITLVDLVLGTPYSGRLEGSGQAQLFRVVVPEARQLRVFLQDSATSDRNEVYLKFGAPPTRVDYQFRYTAAAASQQVVVPTAAPGSWYVLVYSESVQSPGPFSLLASTSTIFLTGITPDHAGSAADSTLTLTGAGFDRTTRVSLVASDGTTYDASAVAVDLPTQITATFRAGAVPPGLYSVRAQQPGGDMSVLPNAFRVVAGGQPHLNTDIVVPSFIGNHIVATIYVDYSNTGNVAMPAPLLVFKPTRDGRLGAILTLDQSRVYDGFWTSALPDGFSNTIQILASGATAGVLQPGESVRVPVYYAGWQQPWNGSTINFDLQVLTNDDSRTIDWDALKDGLRPPSINAQAWDPIYANLISLTGNTWGAYVSMLDNNASYLGRLGEPVTDVNRLWNFQVQQAIGFSTVTTLADTVDAQITQPGLPLTFARFFTPSLLGRYQLGVLGWGWTWSGGWQRTLSVGNDGTVTVADTDGSQRRFQPDSRPGGGYFAQAGDQGTLRNQGAGVFSLQELDGLVTRFRADGRVDFVADTNGNRITAGYTGNLLTNLTHSAGEALQIHYNAAGRIDRVTDSANRATTFTYDPTNQYLMTVQTFDGLMTRYTYDQSADPQKMHALLSIQNHNNTHQFFSYDALGRLNDIHKDGNAEQITFTYGPAGKVAATDAAMNTTQYFFDFRGLLAKVVDPLQNATELAYDNGFNLTQLVDPAGQQYRYQYDSRGNLIHSTDPLGDTVGYVYAANYDRLTAVRDAMGYETRYRYDPQGNLLSITYADSSSEQFVPNAAGDPIQWTNARGTPIQYQRDSAGRVRHVVYADGSHVDYNYDPVRGTLLSASDASGATSLLYEDSQHPDRVTKLIYPDNRYLVFQYDPCGRRNQMTDQDGFIVKYRYDPVGRLERLLDGSDNVIVRYTYYPTGLLQRKDNGNGTYTTYDYTETGQVRHLINYARDSSINSRFDYTYDALGRVATMTTLEGLWTYGYDGIGQLTSVQLPNGRRIQHRYDANGNRTSVTDNGTTTAYTSNNRNEYVTVGTVTYGYDADGNMISKRDGNSLTTYTYDDQNRLVRISAPDGTWVYEYDVFGNRRASTFNGQRTSYLVDPFGFGDVVGEYSGAGGLIAHYAYGLGLTSRVNSSGVAAYYDFDAIGSTTGITDTAGHYVNQYSYLPFGQTMTSAAALPNRFTFVGRYGTQEDGGGTFDMRARNYDPNFGQFISNDPLAAIQRRNLREYANNAPTSRIDPLGTDDFDVFGSNNTYTQNGNLNSSANDCWKFGHIEGGPDHFIGITVGTSTGFSIGWGFGVGSGLGGPWSRWILPLPPFFIPMLPGWGLFYGGFWGFSVGYSHGSTNGWAAGWGWGGGCGGGGGGTGGGRGGGDASPPGPPGGTPGAGGSTAVRAPGDPNDKIGPAGFGPANFMALDRAFPYRIDFENEATATAPAQRVDITDQLASTLDWNTFQWTEIGFADLLVSISPGTQNFQTTVPTTYNGRTFDVQIEVGFHSATGQLYATFLSIDPATSLPPDVLTGFLPPEDGTGRGMGHISYTVRPRADLTTGTEIRNIALVTFDLGETIATDQVDPHDPSRGTDPNKEARVTIDAVPPTSSVDPLPKTSLPSFIVSWAGTDDPGGSGLGFFDIFVSTDGGDFVPWLMHTTLTAAIFDGEAGHTYGFYSIATDNAGNQEATPSSAQATTTVAKAAANFGIVVNAKSVVAGQPFSITVSALDADGNVITDYAGVVHFSSSDIMAGLPDDYPFMSDDAGVHTFKGLTLTRAGSQWVRTIDTATAVSGYTVVTVIPAPADHFRFLAVSHVLSGTPFDIAITALDPYGNIDINYAGTVTFTSTDNDPNVVLPLDYQFTSDDAGVHTFTDTGRGETTLITVGDQTITVSDGTISLDIPITVDPPGSGPSGNPGRGNRPFNRQFVADLFNGVPKTTEKVAGIPPETSAIHFPANPLPAPVDGMMVSMTGQEMGISSTAHVRGANLARNLDDFFLANLIEPWLGFGSEESRKASFSAF